jgi:hypothetical protein
MFLLIFETARLSPLLTSCVKRVFVISALEPAGIKLKQGKNTFQYLGNLLR